MEESTANAQSTGSRDGLGDDEAIEGARLGAVCEDSSSFGEFGDTCDAGVLLVQLGSDNFVFGGANRGKDIGLAFVVAVCTDTCISE